MFQLVPIFASTLLISLNYGALIYINSTFLGDFFPAGFVTTLFMAGYALNIALFLHTPHLIGTYTKEKLLFACIAISAIAGFVLAFASNSYLIALAFVIYQAFVVLIYWCLDIFLEEKTLDTKTGELRGIYYTFLNLGIALGPLVVAFLSGAENLRLIYLIGAIVLLIPLVLSWRGVLRKRGVLEPTPEPHKLPLKTLWRRRNIRAVTIARLILEVFYGVMMLYAPLYLHGTLGFDWAELGLIFTIALLPFVFLEWPAGELADRLYGEKEMMSIGFFICGSALLVMPFLDGSFIAWLMILFISRVGAALIEIMTETYFFKKIDAEDTGFLSIFRLCRPVGLLIGAGLGSLIVTTISYPAVFLGVGVLVLFGLFESLYLKDTR